MITSTLNRKGRTTIPQPVCEALGLREGDEIAYAIEQDRVVVTRRALDDPFRIFSEWASDADRDAYDAL